MDSFNGLLKKSAYVCSIVLLVVGVVMAILSLIVALMPGENSTFTITSLIVPAVCLIFAVIGFVGMKHFKEKK